jgi:Tfp pilus assembly PilM family ATPase
MNSIGIDFRDGCLRILALKDGSARYAKAVRNFSVSDPISAQETLSSLLKEAGIKREKACVILPNDIVSNKLLQVPALGPEDTNIFIKRELSKELKGQKFACGIRKIASEKRPPSGGQYILADYVLAADALTYLDFLKSCGIKTTVMASGLEGNLHMLGRFRPETDGNEALLDIGTDMVEVAVFRNRELIDHEKIPMPQLRDEDVDSTLPSEQSEKIRSYRVIDSLYKFIMSYSKDHPEEKLSALWVCGIGSTLEGLANSITEGLGIPCRLINPFDKEIEDASVFTSLKGISELKDKDVCINLIPEGVLTARKKLLTRVLLTASLVFYIGLLAGGFAVLNRSEKEMKLLFDKVKADEALRISKHKSEDIYYAGQDTFAKLISGSPGLYNVFRDIANLTPSEVMLTDIHAKGSYDGTVLTLTAVIQYTDENFKNAVLSKYLTALDRSSGMRRTSNPEILMPRTTSPQKEVLVKVNYKVTR